MLAIILEYQIILEFPNCSGEDFGIREIKNTVPWTYAFSESNGEEIAGAIYEN